MGNAGKGENQRTRENGTAARASCRPLARPTPSLSRETPFQRAPLLHERLAREPWLLVQLRTKPWCLPLAPTVLLSPLHEGRCAASHGVCGRRALCDHGNFG